MLKVAVIYSKNKSSIHQTVKKRKEMHASFIVIPQTKKIKSV